MVDAGGPRPGALSRAAATSAWPLDVAAWLPGARAPGSGATELRAGAPLGHFQWWYEVALVCNQFPFGGHLFSVFFSYKQSCIENLYILIFCSCLSFSSGRSAGLLGIFPRPSQLLGPSMAELQGLLPSSPAASPAPFAAFLSLPPAACAPVNVPAGWLGPAPVSSSCCRGRGKPPPECHLQYRGQSSHPEVTGIAFTHHSWWLPEP